LPSFDEVKNAITVQLMQQKVQEVVTGLQKEAKIEIIDPELRKAVEDAAKASQLPSASEPSGE
jgi:peptidyl-prolyl cis-trans isomerase C